MSKASQNHVLIAYTNALQSGFSHKQIANATGISAFNLRAFKSRGRIGLFALNALEIWLTENGFFKDQAHQPNKITTGREHEVFMTVLTKTGDAVAAQEAVEVYRETMSIAVRSEPLPLETEPPDTDTLPAPNAES